MAPAMDPLRLPTVPDPAPATHAWRDRVLIALFVAMLPAMAALDPLRGQALASEQRRAEDWPSMATMTSPATFASRCERAFADRFGMRSALILAQHLVLVDAFGVSPTPNAMIGRDGWLFWLGEEARSLDSHYRGTRPLGESEAAAYVAEVKRRHEYFRSRGIAYLVVVVPEKFTIYPEYLPAWVAPGEAPTPLAQVRDRLASDGSVPFVDLRPLLLAAKDRGRLYYQTDSHWNLAGAGIAYAAIMARVQVLLPGRLPTIVPPVRPPYMPGLAPYRGDISRAIGIPSRFVEPDYLPMARVVGDPASVGLFARRTDRNTDHYAKVFELNRPGLPLLVMHRDSMALALEPLLSENFRRSVYLVTPGVDITVIDREHPDIVIDETVERGLVNVARRPLKVPSVVRSP